MKFTTKFNPGDEVYMIHNNQLRKGKIITVTVSSTVNSGKQKTSGLIMYHVMLQREELKSDTNTKSIFTTGCLKFSPSIMVNNVFEGQLYKDRKELLKDFTKNGAK